MTIVMMTVVKYCLHSVDLQSENPWENKAVYLLYSELILGKLEPDLALWLQWNNIHQSDFEIFSVENAYICREHNPVLEILS